MKWVAHMRLHRLIQLACLVLLGPFAGGCMVGPDYERPDAPLSDAWRLTDVPQIAGAPHNNAAWWKVFNDPVLDQLVEQAYEQNLTLQTAGLRVLAARADRGIAAGRFFPQEQRLSGGYLRTNLSKGVANPFPVLDYDDFGFGLNAAWELDFWGKFRRRIESADAALYASVASYDDVLLTLIAEVAATYIDIRAFDERIVLNEKNIALQERTLEIATVKFRNQLVTELDVQQATANLEKTRTVPPFLKIGRRQAENRLCTLLGMPPQDLSEMLDEAKPIPKPPGEIAVGIPADLLRRRPDVRAAEWLAAAQSARIGVATAELLPAISIKGAIGWEAKNASDLFRSTSLVGAVGPGFSWPILNYGRLTNEVRVEDARFQQALSNYQQTVLTAAADVENGLVAFVQNQRRQTHFDKSVAAAIRAEELAKSQYRNGIIGFTRVLQTETFLVNQQDLQTANRRDIAFSLIRTFKALGGGWQLRRGKEFVPAAVLVQMRERTNWGDVLDPDYAEKKDLLFPRPDAENPDTIVPTVQRNVGAAGEDE